MNSLLKVEKIPDFIFAALCLFWVSLTFSPALTEISWMIGFILWLFLKIRSKDFKFSVLNRSYLIPLAAFAAVCILSFFWSEYPTQSFRGILKILQQIFTFIMIAEIFCQDRRLELFEKLTLIWAVVLGVDGFSQYFFGYDLIRHFHSQPSSAGVRITASFKSYGLFASYLICIIPYLFVLGLRLRNTDKKWGHWYFALLGIASSVTLLILTRTRGAFLSLILSILVLFAYKRRFQWIVLIMLVAGGTLMILPKTMIYHLDFQHKEQSIVERFYLWNRAIEVIYAKPLTGTGINTYVVAHSKYDKTKNWRVKNYYAHNGYLQMAAEIGIPGLLFFLTFLFIHLKLILKDLNEVSHRNRNLLFGLLAGIFSFLFFSLVDTVLHNPSSVMIFWFLLGLESAYHKTISPISPR